MADPAEQQAALAEFLTELLLQRLHPEQIPPQPPQPIGLDQALVQIAEAMAVMYPRRRG